MTRQTDGRTYYTTTRDFWILGMQPHALRAITGRAFMIANTRGRLPDRQRIRETERHTDIHIRSTEPHLSPSDISLKINSFQCWTLTLVIVIKQLKPNTRIVKIPRTSIQTDRPIDILYCHSEYLTPWHAAACAARNYGLRFNNIQKVMRTKI